MQKTAQKRTILNKLREMTNIDGKSAEKFFGPQFAEIMHTLKSVDDNIRSVATGQAIDQGDPGPDPISLKKLIQSATTNLNRREFMRAVSDLARFNEHLAMINSEISKLNSKVDEVHHQFLFKDLEPEHMDRIRGLESKFASDITKEAGILDFLHNLVDPRGRALAFYEKRYPNQIGKLKKETESLVDMSERVLSKLLELLKEMATARATRNVDAYANLTAKVKKLFDDYNVSFKKYYANNRDTFDKIKSFSNEPEAEAFPLVKKISPQIGNQEIALPAGNGQPIELQEPQPNTLPYPPAEKVETTPPEPAEPTEEESPTTLRSPPTSMEVREHQQFFNTLKTMSQEDPLILASFIKKYAMSIQDQDMSTALQLLQIANRIKG